VSRITPGTVIVGIFAILFGLVGAYAVQRYLNPPAAPQQAAPEVQRVRLPLASVDLEPGRPLTLGDIAVVSYTREQLKQLDLPDQYMVNPQQIIGRILREPVGKGEAFTTTRFYPEGTGPSVAERLEPGLRAVTVPVEGTGLLSGLASAGARVDVLFRTFPDEENNVSTTTVTLLEDVEVLAVGRNVVPGAQVASDVSAVTLAVTPHQANALKIVEGRGEFSLALRAGDDDSLAADSGPQTLHSLLKIRPKQPPHKTEVWRGNNLQTMTFDDGKLVEQTTIDMPVAPSRKRPRRPAAAVSEPTASTGDVAAQADADIAP
jgi:pilus assembly protein CpaB